jgi:hypothetical protein
MQIQKKENKTQRWEPPTPGVLPQIVEIKAINWFA